MHPFHARRAALRTLGLAVLFAASSVRANPLGEALQAGAANVQRDGSTLTVHQTSDRAILGWHSFSIAPGETARFVQPSSASAILNRVTGSDPSALLGRLQANGRVYLINPNGILVGEGARIDVGSFVASTLDVSDQAFMAGQDLRFAGDSQAGVKVLGTIQAESGDVILIARRVENAGTLRAAAGSVAIGAGSEVLLSESSDRRIQVAASAPEAQATAEPPPGADAALVQRGAIEAARVELEAAAGNLYALAIRNDGVVRAAGVEHRDGRILLTGSGGDIRSDGALIAHAVDGSGGSVRVDARADGTVWQTGLVDTRGEGDVASGGAIAILGQRVAVMDEAVLDASGNGSGDGGSVHLGGETDAQGMRTSPIADALFVAPDAQVRARGGDAGGAGGSVETSAASLGLLAAPDVGAAQGRPGRWLIDPNNLTVVAGAGNTNINAASPFVTTNDNAQLGVNLIQAGLLTSDVTVSTGTGGTNAQPGNLNFNAALDYVGIGTGRTLTLNAHNNLVLNSTISQSGPGTASLNLALNADSDSSGAGAITVNAPLATGGGSATFNRPTSLNANLSTSPAVAGRPGGNVTFQGAVTLPNAAGVNVVTTGPGGNGSITFQSTLNSATAVARNLTLNAGPVSFLGAVGATNTLATLSITSSGAVTQAQAIRTTSLALLGATGNYTLDAFSNPITRLAGNAATIRFRDDSGFSVGTVGATNGINATTAVLLSSTGTVTQTRAIVAPALALLGAGGTFTLNVATNNVTTLAGNTGTLSFRDSNGFAVGTVLGSAGLTTTGNTTLTARGPVTQSEIVTASGLRLLGGGAATYTLDSLSNPITTLAGNAGTIRFRDDSGFAVGTVSTTNGINATVAALLSSTGAATQTQRITTPRLALLGAGGSFTLNLATNNVTTLAGNTGSVSYRDTNGFAVGTVLGTAGLTSSGNTTLTAGGTVTQTQVITASGLALLGAGVTYRLDALSNPITTLAGNAGTIRFRDNTGFAVGTVGATNGLTAATAARLASTGAVTQTQAILAPGLALLGVGGAFTLDSASNDVTTLAGNTGSVSYRDANGFAVGTVLGTAGLTTSGAGGVSLASQGGTLNVAQGISAGPGPVALAIGGSGPGALRLDGSVTTAGPFTASGGASGNTFTLHRVNRPLDITAGSGDDTLVIDGATGSIDPISMPVNFHGQGGSDAIQITNPAAQNDVFAITLGRVQRTSGAPFRVDFDAIESLLLSAGPGNDTVQSQFLVGVNQDLRGGPHAVGDTLDFDALGAPLSSIASPLLASGYGSASYAEFETVNVTNIGSNPSPPAPPAASPAALGLGLAHLDGRTVLVFRYPNADVRILSDEFRAIDGLYDYGVYGLSLGADEQPLVGLAPAPWRLSWRHPGPAGARTDSTLKGVAGSSSFELFSEGDPGDDAAGTPAP